jgi:hypothetical protein
MKEAVTMKHAPRAKELADSLCRDLEDLLEGDIWTVSDDTIDAMLDAVRELQELAAAEGTDYAPEK